MILLHKFEREIDAKIVQIKVGQNHSCFKWLLLYCHIYVPLIVHLRRFKETRCKDSSDKV